MPRPTTRACRVGPDSGMIVQTALERARTQRRPAHPGAPDDPSPPDAPDSAVIVQSSLEVPAPQQPAPEDPAATPPAPAPDPLAPLANAPLPAPLIDTANAAMSGDLLPPDATSDPAQGDENLGYLTELWQAIKTQNIGANNALLSLPLGPQ